MYLTEVFQSGRGRGGLGNRVAFYIYVFGVNLMLVKYTRLEAFTLQGCHLSTAWTLQ